MTEFEIAQIALELHNHQFCEGFEDKIYYTYQECVGMVRMAHGTPIEFVKIYDPLTSKSLEKLLDDIKFLKNKADEEYHRGFKEGKEACAPHIKSLEERLCKYNKAASGCYLGCTCHPCPLTSGD